MILERFLTCGMNEILDQDNSWSLVEIEVVVSKAAIFGVKETF